MHKADFGMSLKNISKIEGRRALLGGVRYSGFGIRGGVEDA